MSHFMNKKLLIIGAARFIGSNLVEALIKQNYPMTIVGLNNMNDYYDVSLKEYRLTNIEERAKINPLVKWQFVLGNIADKVLVHLLF